MRKVIKYIFFAILLILIVGTGLFFSFLFFMGKDEMVPDDTDLLLSKVEIQPKDNAFYFLQEAVQKIYLPKEKLVLFEKMAEGKEWDFDFAKELIDKNKEVFTLFDKAINLPYFQIPEWEDPQAISYTTKIPSTIAFRNLAKLNLIKANFLLSQGNEKEALELLLKTIKMGQLMEDSPRSILVFYLLGRSIKEAGLESLRKILPRLTLPPEILKNYLIELEQSKANEEGLIRTMKMEYISIKKSIDRENFRIDTMPWVIKLFTKTTNYYYKPNQTQRMLVEYFRNFVNKAEKDCDELEIGESKTVLPSSKIKFLFTENVIGKILYETITDSFANLLEKKCLEDFSVSATQLLIALKAYKTETNQLPYTLQELVPKYLPELPKDPFSKGTIKYSPEKKIIYSLGKDLKDSGGSEGEDWTKMEDPTFKIEI